MSIDAVFCCSVSMVFLVSPQVPPGVGWFGSDLAQGDCAPFTHGLGVHLDRALHRQPFAHPEGDAGQEGFGLSERNPKALGQGFNLFLCGGAHGLFLFSDFGFFSRSLV